MIDEQATKPADADTLESTLLENPSIGTGRGISTIPPEVMASLSPAARQMIESVSFQATSGSVPAIHPLLEKITEAHIDKVLDQDERDSAREYSELASQRKYHLVIVVIVLVFLAGMTIFLVRTNSAIYMDVLKLIVPFLAGLGGGYGLKAYQDRKFE